MSRKIKLHKLNHCTKNEEICYGKLQFLCSEYWTDYTRNSEILKETFQPDFGEKFQKFVYLWIVRHLLVGCFISGQRRIQNPFKHLLWNFCKNNEQVSLKLVTNVANRSTLDAWLIPEWASAGGSNRVLIPDGKQVWLHFNEPSPFLI